MILVKLGPGGSPDRRIGGFVFAAVDPQILLAEGRVHEITVMRHGRIGMGIGPEVPATDAHALDGDGAVLLQLTDQEQDEPKHARLLLAFKRADGLLNGTRLPCRRFHRATACLGDDDAQ